MNRYSAKVSLACGLALTLVPGAFLAVPAYHRYQVRQDADNKVVLTEKEVLSTERLLQAESNRAKAKELEAKGILTVDSALTERYLRYLSLKAKGAEEGPRKLQARLVD
jgi:hypothetical protein